MSKKLDDILKDFEREAEGAISSNRPLWEGTSHDDIYSVDIHIWRKPGMGNSLQTIAGNRISIMTATSSLLQTLIQKEIITEKELDEMVKLVKECVRNGKN